MAANSKPVVVEFLDDAPVSRRGRKVTPPNPEYVAVARAGLESGKWGILHDEEILSPLNKAAQSVGVQIKTRRPTENGPLHVQFVDRDLYLKEKAERKAAREAKAAQKS